MNPYDRSGHRKGSFKLGRWNVLRQEYVHAGERIQPRIAGQFRMATMREQMNTPINMTILVCFTPARWLDGYFEVAVQRGFEEEYATSKISPASLSASAYYATDGYLGLGDVRGKSIPAIFKRNVETIYDWHLKWPNYKTNMQSPVTVGDVSRPYWDTFPAAVAVNAEEDPWVDYYKYGKPAVNLESIYTSFLNDDRDGVGQSGSLLLDGPRNRLTSDSFNMVTTRAGSREQFDLRDLEFLQKQLRSEQERTWLAQRATYTDTMREIFGQKVSNEIDKVPLVLHDHREWLGGRNIWSTDADNLGAVAGLMDATMAHEMPYEFEAPEHGIISYWMCLRLPPIYFRGHNPFADASDMEWYDWLADPDALSSEEPELISTRDLFNTTVIQRSADLTPNAANFSEFNLGLVPRGWQWRNGWSCVDVDIAKRNSFAFMDGTANVTGLKYHPNMDRMFQTLATGHGYMEIEFGQRVMSNVPGPFASIMTGTE